VKTTSFSKYYQNLFNNIYSLYHTQDNKSKLLFHGWHHVKFVHDKAIEFAQELGSDVEKVAVAALLHDLNYIFSDSTQPEAARDQIIKYMLDSNYDHKQAEKIVSIIEDSHTEYRGGRMLTPEAQALSDADTLFKSLPITPILFSSKFISEKKLDINILANKIISEQKPLLDKNIYFYSKSANENYLKWAKINLSLWENVQEALKDPSVTEMLENAHELDIF
jgi:uncharacterized protein